MPYKMPFSHSHQVLSYPGASRALVHALSPQFAFVRRVNRINHRFAYAPFVAYKQANNLYFAVFSFQAKRQNGKQYRVHRQKGRGRSREEKADKKRTKSKRTKLTQILYVLQQADPSTPQSTWLPLSAPVSCLLSLSLSLYPSPPPSLSLSHSTIVAAQSKIFISPVRVDFVIAKAFLARDQNVAP